MAAQFKFLKGNYSGLNSVAITEGQILVTKDTRELFVDVDASTRIKIGDFITVATLTELEALDATKVPTSRLYYVEDGNILARSNGTTWIQVNKQPTTEELKTLLGLGTLAYKSEVAEGDLNSALAKKINDASAANHGHDNKDVIDGITADKVSAWDTAEGNAKTYADGLNTAMNTRVEALEAIDHSHTFVESELNKIVDGDVAKWNTASEKAHTHSFNETELNKIVEGDVAKWNGVAADHLTSADKTTLENAIKEAKKAGTDANTALESYKVTNDARVLAVEEDVAEIVDGTNGILAQAKSYSDGKLATARTEISAEIDADVKVVADDLAGYKTSNDAAVAAKVAKADYEADKATFATKTELSGVDAKFADYVTSASYATDKAGIEKAIEDEAKARSDADAGFETRIAALESNFGDGEGTVESQIEAAVSAEASARAEAVKGVQDSVDAVAGRMTTAEGKITSLETESAKHALKTEVEAVDAKFANYKTAEAQKAIDDEQDRRLGVIEGDYLKAADIANFETKANVKKVSDDLAAYVDSNDKALADVKATAEAATTVDEVDAQIDAKITALNLGTTYEPIGAETRAKAYADGLISDANLDQYTTEQEVKDIVDTVIAGAVDGDTITGLANLVEYLNTHGTEAKEMGAAIDVLEGKVETIEGKPAYGITATQISNWDNEVGAKALAETKTTTAEVKDQIEAYGYATTSALDTEKTRAEAKESELAAAIESAKTDASNQDAVVLAEAQAYADQAEADAVAAAEGKVNALAGNVYTKDQTYTQDEVDALLSAATSWGEF